MARLVSILLLVVAVSAAASSERLLWPGTESVCTVRAQPDSKLAVADGSAAVTTGVDYPWPGLRFDFRPPLDLTPYGWVRIAVTNLSDRKAVVALSVKTTSPQGRSPGGQVWLPPHAAGVIQANMRALPWELDAPVALEGMNGYPCCPKGGKGGASMDDVRETTSFHVFRCDKPVPAHFAVTRVSVGGSPLSLKVLPGASFLPFVDKYGQFRHDDWPGKVRSDEQLQRMRQKEAAWLAAREAAPIPGRDRFGGWRDGPQLRATGYFRTEKVDGTWWLVDPDGRLFWSHGVTCVHGGGAVTGVGFRERYFADLPPRDDPAFGAFWSVRTRKAAKGFYAQTNHVPYATYDFGAANGFRKYGPDWRQVTADLAHRRLAAWGLNTMANWSDDAICNLRRTPYTLCLDTGGTPRLPGAQGWGTALPDPDDPAFEATFRARARAASRRMGTDPWCLGVFVDNELAWGDDPRTEDVAEKYFSVVSRVLKDELPNHLYLGCRFASGSEAVFRVASRHCDVVSFNIYSRLPTRDLPPESADRPLIVGEFHFGALDRGLFHTGLVATLDQQERAQCYRTYVEACLDHPRFVGTHWFQYRDQPLTGRADGENYQIGFLTVTDAPYPEMVKAARAVATEMYERRYSATAREKGENR